MVEDYREGGGSIVQSIASTHFEERKQLLEEHEDSTSDYVNTCEDARRRINSIGTRLQAVDLSLITAGKPMDRALETLYNVHSSRK